MIEVKHKSDCAMHNEPAYPKGVCDCGALVEAVENLMDEYSRNPVTNYAHVAPEEVIALVRAEAVEVIRSNGKL